MTLYRRNYTAAELDDTTGPVPTWGNPAGIDVPETPVIAARRECRTHDTRWAEGGCWVCEVTS